MTTVTIRVSSPSPPVARPNRAPAGLLAVSILIIVPLTLPVAYLFWKAFGGGPLEGVLPAGRLLELAFNTITLVAGVVTGALALGTTTAWLTTRTNLPRSRLWSTLITLPLVIPSYVGALALLGATGRQGALTRLIEPLGWGPVPIPRGYLGAFLALTLFTYPYIHLLLVPAFRSIDPGLDEAARGLGAHHSRVFRTVTLPQVAPAMRASALLVGLYTMADFGAVSLLRYDTFTRAIFLQYAGRLDRRPATVLAAMLVALALAVVWWERRSRGSRGVPGGRSIRRARPVELNALGKLGARAFLVVLLMVALILPVTVLVAWLLRGLAAGQVPVGVAAETVRSLGVSGAAALLAALAALPLGILTVRYRSRLGIVVESVTWSLYALPHLTVGLAVLLLGVTLLTPLYQTLPLLLFAYLMMFLPQALGPTQASLRRVSPSLEEASRSLGRSALTTLTRITVPLVGRGILAGAGLVFLTTMKELPATLLLRPTGFETLAVRIWSTTSESFYTRASFAALVLLVVSALPLHFLVTRDLHD
ncbi:MAG TPA: iron ABC transporter permease [Acidimicrobiia bacterium]|nr:iron ABC transporter permease [Acidimicrobiia bacterium]